MDNIIELFVEPFKKWLLEHRFDYLASHAKPVAAIFYAISIYLLTFLGKVFKYIINEIKRKRISKDLHPYYTHLEIKNAIRYYIPTIGQNVAPSRENEPRESHAFAIKNKLIPHFLNDAFQNESEDFRYFIILADSGMGKTTFMINLYLKYILKVFRRKYNIKLLPLASLKVDEEISNIKNKKETILLLDAFDEDPKAAKDYKPRLNDLIEKTEHFRKVLFTCRTQFFPKEEEEPFETGISKFGGEKGMHVFKKIYVSPFDDSDIKKYLNKKYGTLQFWNIFKKRKAKKIVQQSPNLMVRPMLLNYVDDLILIKINFKNSYEIYEALIDKWIQREVNRVSHSQREKFKSNLKKFSEEIALNIFNNQEARGGLVISSDEIEEFARANDIQLELMDLKSRSLLNRDSIGRYKFSHKSILEFFIACKAHSDNEIYSKIFLKPGYDQAKLFIKEPLLEKFTTPFFSNPENLRGYFSMVNNSSLLARDKREIKSLKILNEIKLNEIKKIESLTFLEIPNKLTLNVLEGIPSLSNVYISLNDLRKNRSALFNHFTSHPLSFKINFSIPFALLSSLKPENYLAVTNLEIEINDSKVVDQSKVIRQLFSILAQLEHLESCEIIAMNFTKGLNIPDETFINLKKLHSLQLKNCNLNFECFNSDLLSYVKLENCELRGNLLTLPLLSFFHLTNCKSNNIRGLGNLTNLFHLNLDNSDISFDGLKNLKRISSVSLSGNYVKEQLQRMGEMGVFQKNFRIELRKENRSLKELFEKRYPKLNIKVLDY